MLLSTTSKHLSEMKKQNHALRQDIMYLEMQEVELVQRESDIKSENEKLNFLINVNSSGPNRRTQESESDLSDPNSGAKLKI